jgi:hypothetical protein
MIAYAKSLYRLGESLLEADIAVQNTQGIVILDAVAEALLRAAIAYKSRLTNNKERTFHDLVAEIQKSGILVENPPNYKQLEEIHHVRNQIQHYAVLPDRSHVELLSEYARSNLPLLVSSAFGLDWNMISVTELFKDKVTKALFKAAEASWNANHFTDAGTFLVACFERARILEQTRMFGSLITLKRERASLAGGENDEKLEPIIDFLTSLHNDVEIVKLRLDYKAYMKYRDIAVDTLSPWGDWEGFLDESPERVFESTKKLLATGSRSSDVEYPKSDWLPFAFPFVERSILTWESIQRQGWLEFLVDLFTKLSEKRGTS